MAIGGLFGVPFLVWERQRAASSGHEAAGGLSRLRQGLYGAAGNAEILQLCLPALCPSARHGPA